jgi:hypothetical protein
LLPAGCPTVQPGKKKVTMLDIIETGLFIDKKIREYVNKLLKTFIWRNNPQKLIYLHPKNICV